MSINEKTQISLSFVVTIGTVVFFISSVYFMAARNAEEIRLIRETYQAESRQDATENLRIEARLSVMEAKLEKFGEWCKRLIDELNARNNQNQSSNRPRR